MAKQTLSSVWNQKEIPVVLRRTGKGEKLRVRLPYREGNRRWLKCRNRNDPEWKENLRCWELPKAWFNEFVDRALHYFGKVW